MAKFEVLEGGAAAPSVAEMVARGINSAPSLARQVDAALQALVTSVQALEQLTAADPQVREKVQAIYARLAPPAPQLPASPYPDWPAVVRRLERMVRVIRSNDTNPGETRRLDVIEFVKGPAGILAEVRHKDLTSAETASLIEHIAEIARAELEEEARA
jgi:hypothetical protein